MGLVTFPREGWKLMDVGAWPNPRGQPLQRFLLSRMTWPVVNGSGGIAFSYNERGAHDSVSPSIFGYR